VAGCRDIHRHPLLTGEMGRIIRTYYIIPGISLLRKKGQRRQQRKKYREEGKERN
jgi:hypothetical protein